ncbi:MAG: hypothetical protein FWE24_05065 [Defluviitaleaceae bacterium]|nr:hypothetical protein [Defluviitaleaceae bacterium]
MSIRPIDFQVGAVRAAETTRISNENSNRPDVQHQAFAKELDKQVEIEIKQVNRTAESEFNKITDEGKNKGNSKGKDKKKKDDKDDEKSAVKTAKKPNSHRSMYDVRI